VPKKKLDKGHALCYDGVVSQRKGFEMSKRIGYRAGSNNKKNPNKNVCALAVAKALGVHEETRYLHSIQDVVYAARKHWTVRSRFSAVNGKAGKSVGAIRNKVSELDGRFYIVRVDGHALLLDGEGNTLVDTAPRKRDRRKVTHLYAVY
jgi:hypothetical protein